MYHHLILHANTHRGFREPVFSKAMISPASTIQNTDIYRDAHDEQWRYTAN